MVAETADRESVPEPTIKDNTVAGNTEFEAVPEKRGNRARRVSIVICAITATLVIAFCVVNRNVVVYKPDATQRNTTNVRYVKEEKVTFPGLFTTALGLFGIVLGTLVDRLSLVFEEGFHLHQRYGGSLEKMIKACFSGISWGPVITLMLLAAIIVVILIFLTDKPWFELSYLVYIFSGIGVGPLIMHLLNLNTQSEVHISTILEEKGMYVANGLAWSYYFNYLKQALPKFKETTNNPSFAPNEQITFSLNKLLLLIPHDCNIKDDLNELDKKIKKLYDTGSDQDPFRFPIYRLTVNEHEHKYFVLAYVKEPLKTLREMSLLEDVQAVRKKTCEEEVKLLYRTLSQILSDPPDQHFKGMCILVPIKAKNSESLQNGGLVRCIMDVVQLQPSCSTQVDGARGFVKPREDEKLFVNVGSSSKPTTSSAQTVKNPDAHPRLTHEVTIHEQQGKRKRTDPDDRNKQDDDGDDKKGKNKGKALKRKYKYKTSKETELQVMIPAENNDPSDIDHYKPNEALPKPKLQEVGDENDSGASTSGNSSQMVHTPDGSQPSDQTHQSNHTDQDEHSSNDEQDLLQTSEV